MTQARLTFRPNILFLSKDPALVERQLQGAALSLSDAGPLRDDISTDEITPLPTLLAFDERLGEVAHIGFKAGDRLPIVRGALKAAGITVLVGGKRYGKGSSREHSPVAEQAAGVRLIIAESFERIYRQNCDNVGLFTSTDFGLIDRIRAGEEIPLEDLLQGRERLAAAILRAGGLLAYGQAHLRGLKTRAAGEDGRPRTLVQKIIERHALEVASLPWNLSPGTGGFVRADLRFIHEYYTGMAAHMLHARFGQPLALDDPGSIVLFEDHLSYAHRSPTHVRGNLLGGVKDLSQAHRRFAADYALRNHGYLEGEEGSEGISHAMVAERYALPGQLIVGTDSHTPHSGALGCLAYGVGTTDMANAFMTSACRITVPETLRIRLEGDRRPGVSAKDLVLHLLALPEIRKGFGLGKVFEYCGSAIAGMSVDERATMTNMVAELGGLTGIVAPDAQTVAFLKERRGIDFEIEPWMCSDEGAPYAAEIVVDVGAVGPMLAAPGDPGNGLAADAIDAPVRIDIAYGGSCTAGKRDDFDAYHEVLHWAYTHGLTVDPRVKLYLQYGTTDVRDYCAAKGYLETFAAMGAEMLNPACGACGQCGPGVSTAADQVTISAINRNFPGRGGPGGVWLASPSTVVASAIAGEVVTFEELKRRHAARGA